MKTARVLIAVSTLFLGGVLRADRHDLVFSTLDQPCRVVDTRLAGGPLLSGTQRNFVVAGNTGFEDQGGTGGGCGIPDEATAAVINFVAVNPTGGGNLRGSAFPTEIPAIGSIINYQAVTPTLNIANGLQFPICDRSTTSCTSDISIKVNGASTHLVADVLGFFTSNHQHSGEDISSGLVAEGRIDAAVARDSEVMPTVLANDGSGSTLDADLLDGLQAADFSSAGHHHDSAYERKYARTIVVRSGATATQNGTALLNAIAGITGNSATNSYLVELEPGIYDLGSSPLTMKEFVDIEGGGELVTRITRAGIALGNSGTVVGANNCELRFLTVENTGGPSTWGIAIYLVSASTRFVHVTATASGGGNDNYGLRSINASPIISYVTASAAGGHHSYGMSIVEGAARVSNSQASASGATSINHGLQLAGNHLVRSSSARATGGIGATALEITGTGTTIVRDSVADASSASISSVAIEVFESSAELINVSGTASGTESTALYNYDSSTRIIHSALRAVGSTSGTGIRNSYTSGTSSVIVHYTDIEAADFTISSVAGFTTRVAASHLKGGPVSGGTNLCAGVFDENYTFYPDTCP